MQYREHIFLLNLCRSIASLEQHIYDSNVTTSMTHRNTHTHIFLALLHRCAPPIRISLYWLLLIPVLDLRIFNAYDQLQNSVFHHFLKINFIYLSIINIQITKKKKKFEKDNNFFKVFIFSRNVFIKVIFKLIKFITILFYLDCLISFANNIATDFKMKQKFLFIFQGQFNS